MIVSSVLQGKSTDLVTVTPDMTIHETAKLLAKHKIGAVIVKENSKMAGIVSERDIVREFSKTDDGCSKVSVSSIMTRSVKTTSPDVSLTDVLTIMTSGRFRHMPVLANEEIVGIVSIGDIVKFRLKELETEAENLSAYVSGGY